MTSRFAIRLRVWAVTPLTAGLLLLSAAGLGAEQSLAELLGQLQHPREAGARLRAAEALAEYGEYAVPALRRLIVDGDALVRSYACVALVRMGPRAAAAVPDLIEIGRNPGESNDLRETAILALGQIGPPASPAFPMLQKVLRETLCPQLRQEVFSALAALDTPEAVAALIDMLEHGDQQERLAILDGFSAQGAKAKSAAAALLAFAARHPDSGLCDWVFLTVTAFGPETAVELAAYLQADQLEIRRRAAFALSRLGSDTAAAVPALSEALRDEAEIVRFWAAKALGNIGPEARQATGPLLSVLGDADPNVRWQATTAIAKIDLGAITEDDWSRLLADPDPGVRQRAATIRSASL